MESRHEPAGVRFGHSHANCRSGSSRTNDQSGHIGRHHPQIIPRNEEGGHQGHPLPHRLGLSETILVFRQHTAFIGGLEQFLDQLAPLKARAPENKVIVEADTAEEALKIAAAGADVVQVDKMPPEQLTILASEIHRKFPGVKISAAGGINADNAALYAGTGVDMLVLSSVYFGKPADISVVIQP